MPQKYPESPPEVATEMATDFAGAVSHQRCSEAPGNPRGVPHEGRSDSRKGSDNRDPKFDFPARTHGLLSEPCRGRDSEAQSDASERPHLMDAGEVHQSDTRWETA